MVCEISMFSQCNWNENETIILCHYVCLSYLKHENQRSIVHLYSYNINSIQLISTYTSRYSLLLNPSWFFVWRKFLHWLDDWSCKRLVKCNKSLFYYGTVFFCMKMAIECTVLNLILVLALWETTQQEMSDVCSSELNEVTHFKRDFVIKRPIPNKRMRANNWPTLSCVFRVECFWEMMCGISKWGWSVCSACLTRQGPSSAGSGSWKSWDTIVLWRG